MIKLVDVHKSYILPKVKIEVLRGINIDILEKEFVALMGPSGSGKSTLLHIIGCLDRPTSGKYLFLDVDVSNKTDNELAEIRNKSIGFVFQSFNLLPRLSAWKNVELPLLYSGVSVKERKQRSIDMLGKVGLSERAEHHPNELSGGEQQRVAIARALVNKPTVILADEPTGNLDSRSGKEIIDLFKALNKEGVTILIVTHEKAVAEEAKRIITIKDGTCFSGCY